MKHAALYFLTLALFLTGISRVQAHAFLDHADPRVGSTVKAAPTVVKIWFTEELEPAFSRIKVFNNHKVAIDNKDVKVDALDKKLLSVSVPKLEPGRYHVYWNVVATDTHHTEGSFIFEVSGP